MVQIRFFFVSETMALFRRLFLVGGNSNILHFHPYLGKISNLTSIFLKWVETTNQFCFQVLIFALDFHNVSFPSFARFNTPLSEQGIVGGLEAWGSVGFEV